VNEHDRVRWRRAALLAGAGLAQPVLAFFVSGWLLYPDWSRRTPVSDAFDPIFVGMLAVGFVLTLAAAAVTPGTPRRRLVRALVAVGVYGAAFLVGSCGSIIVFGLPID
jgi:hypothetical protein